MLFNGFRRMKFMSSQDWADLHHWKQLRKEISNDLILQMKEQMELITKYTVDAHNK